MSSFYTFQPVTMHRTISLTLSKLQMGKIITVCENNSNRIRGKFGLGSVPGWTNAIINELYLTAHINSLPDVPLPIFDEFASQSDRLNATLKYEWGTARIELELLLGDPQGNWSSLGETALKNSSGYRYRRHRLLDLLTDNPGFQLEENFKLGVILKNMGFGDITDKDNLSITGNWLQEFVAVQAQPPYVINNVYGSTGTPSPSPSPTPTPVTPTFTLSLGQGKTTAVANNSDAIVLTTTGLSAGTNLTATWYKGETSQAVNETLLVTSSGIITLDSSKLLSKGTGNYKLKITYSGTDYLTNEVSVTANPDVTVTITATASGDTNFFVVGDSVTLDIQGRYFTSGSATYTWYRNNVALTNTGTLTVDTNGNFTLNQLSSNASFYTSDGTSKEGTYKLRITQGTTSIDSNGIYGADRMPNVALSPSTVSIANSSQNVTVQIYNFTVNTAIETVWIKDGVELSASNTAKTYTENGGNPFSGYNYQFTVPASSFGTAPLTGAGSYKLKVKRTGTPVNFTSPAITVTA